MHTPLSTEDKTNIADVIYRWCRAIDRKDFDSIFDCFHPGASDDHVFYTGPIEGLVQTLQVRHEAISFSMHSVSNVLIECVARDVALVESYVKVVQRRPLTNSEGALAAHDSHVSEVYCRYVDTFERRDGQWKISRRVLVIDTAMEYTDKEPLHRIPGLSSINRGRRDLSDAIYAEREKFA